MDSLKCYIYGAGEEYQRLSSYLPLYKEKIKVLGIVTTWKLSYSHFDGFPCILPAEMQITKMDYVIIAVKNWKEIYFLLKNLGIEDEKILRSNIFYFPNFDLYRYLRLKKSKVSILSNSCMGGMIYMHLGLKSLSPTINASCPNESFIEFLRHYDQYLNKDMKVYDKQHNVNTYDREMFRPTGIIDDRIMWHFPHAENVQAAVETWNKKRKQVNYDNIAALMIIYTDRDAVEFEKLPIKKKLGFYYKDFHLKSVIYYPEWESDKIRFKYEFFWHRYVLDMLKDIDWIKFLNGEEGFIRYRRRGMEGGGKDENRQ